MQLSYRLYGKSSKASSFFICIPVFPVKKILDHLSCRCLSADWCHTEREQSWSLDRSTWFLPLLSICSEFFLWAASLWLCSIIKKYFKTKADTAARLSTSVLVFTIIIQRTAQNTPYTLLKQRWIWGVTSGDTGSSQRCKQTGTLWLTGKVEFCRKRLNCYVLKGSLCCLLNHQSTSFFPFCRFSKYRYVNMHKLEWKWWIHVM